MFIKEHFKLIAERVSCLQIQWRNCKLHLHILFIGTDDDSGQAVIIP